MGTASFPSSVLLAAFALAAVGTLVFPACAASVQDASTPAPYLKGRTDKDPPSYFFDEKPGTIVLARYAIDRKPAIVRRGKHIAVGQAAGLTPRFFNRLVREAGGYVPVEKGLQVDMNGSFLSVTVFAAVLSVVCAGGGLLVSILFGTPVGSTIVAADMISFGLCALAGRLLRR